MTFEGWVEISPESPKPPEGKKCELLFAGVGHFAGQSDGDGLEFNFKKEGIRRVVAWREIDDENQ